MISSPETLTTRRRGWSYYKRCFEDAIFYYVFAECFRLLLLICVFLRSLAVSVIGLVSVMLVL